MKINLKSDEASKLFTAMFIVGTDDFDYNLLDIQDNINIEYQQENAITVSPKQLKIIIRALKTYLRRYPYAKDQKTTEKLISLLTGQKGK